VVFNIVHIQPPDLPSAQSHWDIARLLHVSFRSLGHDATLQINKLESQAMNILVGYERAASLAALSSARFIPYQLEQIAAGDAVLKPHMREILKGAAEVWDYDPRNLETLKQLGVTSAKLLPIGYHQGLATIPPQTEDVDILFYGRLNDRRSAVLDALKPKCAVQALSTTFGQERDRWISRAKIVLNIHYYPAQMAEQVRVSYLLNNSKCVVTEESDWDPLAQWCAVAPYQRLAESCLNLLKNDAERRRMITNAREGFQTTSMAENLRHVL
jgi:hypothetical protein